jgi:hypothetical protein
MNGARLLPFAVAAGAVVPLAAGLAGVVQGLGFVGAGPGPAEAESHFRYLSGLLLGLGCGFAWCALALPRRGQVFTVLCGVVVLGGLGRLLGLALGPPPPWPHLFGMGMELVVTPALWLWARAASQNASDGR